MQQMAFAPALLEEIKPPLDELDAIVEADRCLACGGVHAPAPCSVACPADIDVPSFVSAIARRRPRDAPPR